MSGLPDLKVTLFDNVTLTTAFQFSSGITVREFRNFTESIEVLRVTLLGSITLNAAAFLTLRTEVSSDGVAWRPLADYGPPVNAGGVSTSDLLDHELKRSFGGALPAMSFEPDAAFFRVGAKGDVAGAQISLDAYLNQTAESV